MTPLAFGVGVGFGIAAYRNMPPMPERAAQVAVFVLAVALIAVWIGGRRHGRMSQSQHQEQHQEQHQAQGQQQVTNVTIVTEAAAAAATAAHAALTTSESHQETSERQEALESHRSPVLVELTGSEDPSRTEHRPQIPGAAVPGRGRAELGGHAAAQRLAGQGRPSGRPAGTGAQRRPLTGEGSGG